MKQKVIILLLLGFNCFALGAMEVHTEPGDKRIEQEETGRLMNNEDPVIIFIGDSLTAGGKWKKQLGQKGIINTAVAGETTADILARIDDIANPDAEQYFIMAGVNDLNAGVPPKEIFENLMQIVARLQQVSPDAAFYVQSIMPVNKEVGDLSFDPGKIRAINAHLRKLENPSIRLFYLNVFAGMANAKGQMKPEYTSDGIHLTRMGYSIWADIIRPYIRKPVKKK